MTKQPYPEEFKIEAAKQIAKRGQLARAVVHMYIAERLLSSI